MKDLFYIVPVVILLFIGVTKCSEGCKDTQLYEVASSSTTWMFRTSEGDTIYSTMTRAWGMPAYGNIGARGCLSNDPPRWYYGDCLTWELVKDDCTHQPIHPTCIFVGLKQDNGRNTK